MIRGGFRLTLALLAALAVSTLGATPPTPPLSYSEIGGTVTDDATTNFLISVPDSFTIEELKVAISLEHADIGDLTASLISPAGVEILLIPFVADCINDDDWEVTITDDGLAPGPDCFYPFQANIQPADEPLSVYDGTDAQGTWTVRIVDSAAGDEGTLNWIYLLFHRDVDAEGNAAIQSTANSIQTDVTMVKNQLATLQADVTMVKSQVTTLQSDVTMVKAQLATLQATLDMVKNQVTALQADVTMLKAQVAQIQADINMIKAQLAMLERVEVEKALHNGEYIGLFARPIAFGGKLELVQMVVQDTIDKTLLSGQTVHSAQSLKNAGDTSFGNGDYKMAFRRYMSAYCHATSRSNEIRFCP